MDDNLHSRLDRIELQLQSVRVKLENGMEDCLSKLTVDVEEVSTIVRRLEKEADPAIRLAHCPYKVAVEEKYGKKAKFLMALYALLIAAAAGAPAWITLLLRGG